MDFDLILVGGGLASGLAALRLAQQRPEAKVAIVEASDHIGGDHIWSSFDTDMRAAQRAWTAPLYAMRWPGYDVRFPRYARGFSLGYASARSARLDAAVRAAMPAERLFCSVAATEVDLTSVTLADGRRLSARVVIDGRGHRKTSGKTSGKTPALDLAWQKFVGLEIETDAPHGLTRPLVMDATVEQAGGYRFVYVLPWDDRRLLVEDTYYSEDAALPEAQVRARIADYIAAAGWGGWRELRCERGVLPLALGGDIDALLAESAPVPAIGLRAGLFHAVTGYSFPDAVRTADLIASLPRLDADLVQSALASHAIRHWQQGRYYRLLNRMMFRAADPGERYRVLQHFYALPEPLVSRFYAGTSTIGDKLRILAGKPPVPIGRALGVIAGFR